MDKREDLIKRILEKEMEMFGNVPASSKPRETAEGFRIMRGGAFETWSDRTLQLYLKDLVEASMAKRNLMTDKYARMGNLIPPLNCNPIIHEIVVIEARWQTELSGKYPHTFGGYCDYTAETPQGTGFRTYLECELETYSDQTLESYFKDICTAMDQGQNLAEERFTRIFKRAGFASIDEMEEENKKRAR